MKTARVTTVAPDGLTGQLVTVEVATRPGISSLKIVGLAGRTVAEAKERVRVALRGCGVRLPATNIVVNLAPAELNKTGTHYDLPIALGLLIATGQIPPNELDDVVVAGELALNGELRSFQHGAVIAFAAEAAAMKLLTAPGTIPSTGLAKGLLVASQSSLGGLIDSLKNRSLKYHPTTLAPVANPPSQVLLEDIAGLALPKRALTLAAAGGHNLLLCGSPGVGKSLLASAGADLLPPLDDQRRRQLTALHSRVIDHPPVRAPHHSATVSALIGGGTELHPGEISLAHGGILFLDELPRYEPAGLQALLEPLESGVVHLSRNGRSVDYPADCLVIGAYNPCPCGYFGDVKVACRCPAGVLARYQARLTGPLLSRFSLFAPCRSSSLPAELTMAAAQLMVATVHEQIVRRHQGVPNGRVPTQLISQWLATPSFKTQTEALLASGRGWRAVINAGRVARTIADVVGSLEITPEHLTEAIGWLPPLQDIF